ncbi:enoyl-CoA hydratase/isomerase family protein [Microbacterium sp. YY-01]|uniref:enoyl-CoA hydratase/isomerase family protein n=1 Tax=Microbacterium sp. YY-01 TaxID=3421634 RepID=UPI003D172BF0
MATWIGLIIMTSRDFIECERNSEIAIIRLNRPRALNALSQQMMGELLSYLDKVQADPTIRGVVISSTSERAFSAGADTKEIATLSRNEFLLANRRGAEVFQRIEEYPLPVAAAIRGFALGGGLELALACDFRFADETAVVGLPEVLVGFIPGWGGIRRLSAIVGVAKAKELVLKAVKLDAHEAHRLGLFTSLPAANPEEAAVAQLRELPATASASVAHIKHLFSRIIDESDSASVSTMFVAELIDRDRRSDS